jgi:RNA polymerase sigma-70 factor (ECF subfamily)
MVKAANDLTLEKAPFEGAGSSTSLSLLVRVKAGDGEAWQRLVELYGPLVYGWCRRQGLQAAAAADVGQEVFLAVSKSIANFRRDRPDDSFRGWLWGITRHKLADYRRRIAAQPPAVGGSNAQQLLAQVPEDVSTDSGSGIESGDANALLHRALELVRLGFEDRTWQAFWRVTVDGKTAAEVAGELGMSRNAVHVAKCKVLRRLREEFGDLID